MPVRLSQTLTQFSQYYFELYHHVARVFLVYFNHHTVQIYATNLRTPQLPHAYQIAQTLMDKNTLESFSVHFQLTISMNTSWKATRIDGHSS